MQHVVCLNCEEVFSGNFRKDRPRKFCSNKCSREHNNKSRKSELHDVSCLNCGYVFQTTEGQSKTRKFCSKSCSAEYNNSLRLTGIGSKRRLSGLEKVAVVAAREKLIKENTPPKKPRAKKKLYDKVCAFCDKDFKTKRKVQKFCCNDCSLANRKANKKPPKIHSISCLYCGDKYESKNSKKSFCSQSCAVKFDEFIEPKNIKHKKCKDCSAKIVSSRTFCDDCFDRAADVRKRVDIAIGKFKELFPYPLWRRKVSNQGHKTAKLIPNECKYCGYDKHVEVCHIKPIQDFPDDAMYIAEINAPENLIKLCPNHHWELDYGDLSLKEIFKL